jgi:WD40 repeat protein
VVLVFIFTGCSSYSSSKTIESLEKIREANMTAETTIPRETTAGITAVETTVAETTVSETVTAETTASVATTKGKIVFMSDRDGNYEIYTMNVDGTEQVNLTNNPAVNGNPSFSPDGSKIAFDSTRDENYEIYIMNIDGSEQVRLTNNTAVDVEPSFSPDGSKIAFDSTRDGNYEIYIMNIDGSEQVNLTNNQEDDMEPSFSPDGSKIVFASVRDGSYEIYTMNIDGSEQVNLEADTVPTFSPDGSKIAFSSFLNGNFEIFTLNVDGSGQKKLTNNPANDESPSFSPDGSKIVFSSVRDGNYEIYIMNVDGSEQVNLTNNPANDLYPSFPPIPETTVETTTVETKEKGEYNIGDTGPAGGLIFYVNPNYITDGWRYLEAAPGDQSIQIQWCNGSFVKTGATATTVGAGQANTQTIVKIQGTGSYAAQLCNDLTQGGCSDWFLPSKDELNLMYENLQVSASLGGFVSDYYWSSSEVDENGAWIQSFGYDGYQVDSNKVSKFIRVRAARAF